MSSYNNRNNNVKRNYYINNKGIIIQSHNLKMIRNNENSNNRYDFCKIIILFLLFLICFLSGINKFLTPNLNLSSWMTEPSNSIAPLNPDFSVCDKIG